MSFATAVEELVAEFLRLWPVNATELGNHDHDARWPDLSDAGQRERMDFLRAADERLAGIDASSLPPEDAIDLRILREELAAMRFGAETLEENRWNPLSYVYLFGNGLFALLARDFAPLPERLRSAAGRLSGLPAALDSARDALSTPGRRATSTFHTEKAITQLSGVTQLAEAVVAEAEKTGDELLHAELTAAAGLAGDALEAWGAWLRDELLPAADGDFRLGPDLYAEKFSHALRSSLTPAQVADRARSEFTAVRGEMLRLARELWPAWIGTESTPDDDGELVRRVLDAIAADHPAADELLDFCREENARIEAFVRERDLIGLPDEPLEIIWTPQFLRAFGGAMLIPPGPLDRGLASFFAITPMPDDWTDEQRESYLREDNRRMLRLLTIHEAVPGHFLQLAYSNRTPSLVRAIFQSGVFAEGWAVYVTQVMMEIGYGAEDPALMLVHWKFYLRAVTNALMDVGIHAREMSQAEAIDLMVRQGFQEESEAANKWDRARLSSTQLCEYFVGSVEMHSLEARERRRAIAAGEEFRYRPWFERLLSHGMPSMPVIGEILFGGD